MKYTLYTGEIVESIPIGKSSVVPGEKSFNNQFEIIDRITGINKKNRTAWVVCKCNCGNYFTSTINSIRAKQVKSCGCLNSAIFKEKGKLVGNLPKKTKDYSNVYNPYYSFVEKTEEANFSFFNRRRSWDGFVLLTEGSGFAIDKNGVRHPFEKGDVIIACEGDSYTVEFEEPCSYITTAFSLSTDKSLLPFITRCTERQYNELVKICRIWQSRSWDSYVKCRVGLIGFYLDVIGNGAGVKNVDKDIERIIPYVIIVTCRNN